jgi:hypothetical protein
MEEITHSYRVVAADVTSFNLVTKVSPFERDHILDYAIEQEQKLDFERKHMAYTTSVVVMDKNNDEQLLDFKTICFFELKIFDQHITILPERTFKITPAIRDSMSRVAVGITRGLMCARLKDTYISNAILPLLPFEF